MDLESLKPVGYFQSGNSPGYLLSGSAEGSSVLCVDLRTDNSSEFSSYYSFSWVADQTSHSLYVLLDYTYYYLDVLESLEN